MITTTQEQNMIKNTIDFTKSILGTEKDGVDLNNRINKISIRIAELMMESGQLETHMNLALYKINNIWITGFNTVDDQLRDSQLQKLKRFAFNLFEDRDIESKFQTFMHRNQLQVDELFDDVLITFKESLESKTQQFDLISNNILHLIFTASIQIGFVNNQPFDNYSREIILFGLGLSTFILSSLVIDA